MDRKTLLASADFNSRSTYKTRHCTRLLAAIVRCYAARRSDAIRCDEVLRIVKTVKRLSIYEYHVLISLGANVNRRTWDDHSVCPWHHPESDSVALISHCNSDFDFLLHFLILLHKFFFFNLPKTVTRTLLIDLSFKNTILLSMVLAQGWYILYIHTYL